MVRGLVQEDQCVGSVRNSRRIVLEKNRLKVSATSSTRPIGSANESNVKQSAT